MKRLAVFLFVILFASTASSMDKQTALEKGRVAARALNDILRAKLSEALTGAGPAGAMSVCSSQAQALTAEIRENQGVEVKRTTLKLRNPKNAPDPYEQELLERLDAKAAEGSLPDEVFEPRREDGRRVYRYAKPLTIAPLCLSCHGLEEEIPADVRGRLEEQYPEDRATGYRPGDFRGIVSVIIPAE